MATLPHPTPVEQGGGTRRAYALRARLRHLAESSRVASCGSHVVMVGEVVEVVVREHGAHWRGVLVCGRAHSCPACALRRGASAARDVAAVLRADLDREGRAGSAVQWRMVTLTVPHQRGEHLADVSARLVAAWRRTRATRAVRAIFDARVSATCRAREATWSPRAGWHPHVHLVMRSLAWTDAERETLARAWCAALGVPFDDAARPNGVSDAGTFGVRWSTPCTSADGIASYVSKMGLEVAGGLLKAADGKGDTPWQLAARAARGGRTRRERERARTAARLWAEYQQAARGRRLLEMDERMAAMVEAVTESNEPLARYQVFKEEYAAVRACERWRPDALYEPLAAAMRSESDLRAALVAAGVEARDRGRLARARPPPDRAAGAGPPTFHREQPAAVA